MRQQGIIYVPQRKAFFSTLSIVTNLELACTQKARNDRRRLIKLALQRFSSLNDNARRTAVSLSGGERKLLAFACGVIVPPSLLLADEPLAGLSPRARSTMLGHLKHATQESGVTILLVEHDVLKATRIADRVIGFREGRLVVDCPSSEFDDSLQRRVFLD
jgi:ABC-type branched-subunit amino acid transport system ATPase component